MVDIVNDRLPKVLIIKLIHVTFKPDIIEAKMIVEEEGIANVQLKDINSDFIVAAEHGITFDLCMRALEEEN